MLKKKKIILVIFTYILTLCLVIFLLPKNQKFGYEYIVGKPWEHSSLFAPFNFPIYKSAINVQQETDSIQKHSKLYFRKKSQDVQSDFAAFKSSFNAYFFAKSQPDKIPKQFSVSYLQFVRHLVDSLHNIGIISNQTIEELPANQNRTIVIIDNNFSKDYHFNQLITLKDASEYFIKKNNKFLSKYPKYQNDFNAFYSSINLNILLKTNLFYDNSFSNKQLNNNLKLISKTLGMVQKGERIISYGEIINDYKFRILNSLKREYEDKGNINNNYLIIVGYCIIISFIFLSIFLFIYNSFKNKSTVPHYLVLLLLLVFYGATLVIVETKVLNIYIIPFIVLPIIIRAFYDESVSLFIFFAVILLISVLVPNSFEFILLNYITGIVAIFSLRSFTARSHFLKTVLASFATYSLLYSALLFIQGKNFSDLLISQYIWFAISSFLILLSYGLIFIFERGFGLLSEISLIELSNTNRVLLKQLSEKAPGTFQHTLQVANLAEEAANKINVNGLLIRTGALYHDIGKMENPEYFTENQPHGVSPHTNISTIESAKIIIKHITDGVRLARKHRLPNQIIDFIRTHHGTGKTEYFYRTFIKKNPETTVNDDAFSYPGPKPFSQETALLMMADSVEAASRSLSSYSVQNISDLVDKIINFQFNNKQFDDSNLTLQEISIIKSTFKIKLQTIYHTRIKYPESDEK